MFGSPHDVSVRNFRAFFFEFLDFPAFFAATLATAGSLSKTTRVIPIPNSTESALLLLQLNQLLRHALLLFFLLLLLLLLFFLLLHVCVYGLPGHLVAEMAEVADVAEEALVADVAEVALVAEVAEMTEVV